MIDERTARRSGVTLLELLLATAVAAAVILATLGLWQAGLHDRRSAQDRAVEIRRVARLRERLRADIGNALYTGGMMAARFSGAAAAATDAAAETVVLELITTGDRAAGGADLALVEYRLAGNELHRAVRRDLLATVWTAIEGTPLIDNVAAFDPAFYDGSTWASDWNI